MLPSYRNFEMSIMTRWLLQEIMRPLAKAATMLPPTAFRFDPGAAITVFAR